MLSKEWVWSVQELLLKEAVVKFLGPTPVKIQVKEGGTSLHRPLGKLI